MLCNEGSNMVPENSDSTTVLKPNVSYIFNFLPVLFMLKTNSIWSKLKEFLLLVYAPDVKWCTSNNIFLSSSCSFYYNDQSTQSKYCNFIFCTENIFHVKVLYWQLLGRWGYGTRFKAKILKSSEFSKWNIYVASWKNKGNDCLTNLKEFWSLLPLSTPFAS